MLRVFMALHEYWDRKLFVAAWKEGNYAALAAFMEVWSMKFLNDPLWRLVTGCDPPSFRQADEIDRMADQFILHLNRGFREERLKASAVAAAASAVARKAFAAMADKTVRRNPAL
jgi:hypothetical protein